MSRSTFLERSLPPEPPLLALPRSYVRTRTLYARHKRRCTWAALMHPHARTLTHTILGSISSKSSMFSTLSHAPLATYTTGVSCMPT